MATYQFSYDEKGCKKFFKTYHHQEKTIKQFIERQLTRQIDTDFSKTKLATRIEVDGHKCYECRVNLPQTPNIRVAFTVDDKDVVVRYVTTNITKADFTHELEHFLSSR